MKWIKCEDQLPEKSGRYLVYEEREPHSHNCAAYNYPIACCKPNIAYFRCFQMKNWEYFSSCNDKCKPTHWMSLPVPPTEDNKHDKILQDVIDEGNKRMCENVWMPLPEKPE